MKGYEVIFKKLNIWTHFSEMIKGQGALTIKPLCYVYSIVKS